MITTPENFDGTTEISADVIIIGSGCGGAITAAKLSAQGYSVVILEEGEYVTKEDFNQNPRELVPRLYRQNASLGTDDQSLRILQGKTFGGSTTINWMTSLRTPDWVLKEWADRFGLEEYLPENMQSHFDTVEKRLNVHKVPDYAVSPANRIILEGAKALKMHHDILPNNSKDCIGCGGCGLGCPYDAKQDMRLTYLKDAIDQGTHAYTSTRAYRIVTDAKDRHTVKATMKGQTLRFNAKRVVVSGSAIMSPLLLQESGLTKGGQVGKNLSVHPVTATIGLFESDIHPTYGIPQSATAEYFDETGYGYWLESPDLEVFLAGVNYPAIGSERREGLKKLYKSSAIIVLVRDGADGKTNGEVRWRRGINTQNGRITFKKVPSIRYRLSPTDLKHMRMGLEAAVRIMFKTGAKEVRPFVNPSLKLTNIQEASIIKEIPFQPNRVSLFSAHPLGTCRMAKQNGVVDETGQMHHYKGVYVLDGSILPTAVGVNPMISILATVSRAIELGNLDL
ncbi:MAG: hypothetical protein D6732_06160 [Methanobacteriota archaeon]|nr:MAG: hypothetical protein D6732_06160 [Euryarchaeota archaeon]